MMNMTNEKEMNNGRLNVNDIRNRLIKAFNIHPFAPIESYYEENNEIILQTEGWDRSSIIDDAKRIFDAVFKSFCLDDTYDYDFYDDGVEWEINKYGKDFFYFRIEPKFLG